MVKEQDDPQGQVLVAVAADGQLIAEHFSRAKMFVIAGVAPARVGPVRIVSNPGHVHGGYGTFFAGLGVDVVVAGSIGPRSVESIQSRGMTLHQGLSGPVEAQLKRLAGLPGTRKDSLTEPITRQVQDHP